MKKKKRRRRRKRRREKPLETLQARIMRDPLQR